MESGEPTPLGDFNNSVWFSWTSLEGGEATAQLVGATGPVALAIYTGTSISALTPIATAPSSTFSTLEWNALPGQVYLIQAASAARASFTLNVAPQRSPAIALELPMSGAVFDLSATVPLKASLTDPAHPLAKIEFFANNSLVGAITSAAGEVSWRPTTASTNVEIFAKVTDSAGFLAYSQTNTIVLGLLPPSNDQFADAAVVSGFVVDDHKVFSGAAREADEPATSEPGTLWWRWIAPNTSTFTVLADVNGAAPSLRAFTGDVLESLAPIGAGEISPLYDHSRLVLHALAGQEYRFQVSATTNATLRQARLRLRPGAPPQVVLASPTSPEISTNMPIVFKASVLSAQNPVSYVSYHQVAPYPAGRHYLGMSFAPPYALTTKEAIADTHNRTVVARAVDAAGLEGFSAPLKLSDPSVIGVPENDAFTNAFIIREWPIYWSGKVSASTLEFGEPATSSGLAPVNSVWFRWTAPADGFALLAASYQQTFEIFTGDTLDTLLPILPAPVRRAPVQVRSGVGYYIRVSGRKFADYSKEQFFLGFERSTQFTLAPPDGSVLFGTNLTALVQSADPDKIRNVWFSWRGRTIGVAGPPFTFTFTNFYAASTPTPLSAEIETSYWTTEKLTNYITVRAP